MRIFSEQAGLDGSTGRSQVFYVAVRRIEERMRMKRNVRRQEDLRVGGHGRRMTVSSGFLHDVFQFAKGHVRTQKHDFLKRILEHVRTEIHERVGKRVDDVEFPHKSHPSGKPQDRRLVGMKKIRGVLHGQAQFGVLYKVTQHDYDLPPVQSNPRRSLIMTATPYRDIPGFLVCGC